MALAGLSQLLPWSETPPAPQCTLTYTPYMTPQIGPTTTIYGAIMTTYFYVSAISALSNLPIG